MELFYVIKLVRKAGARISGDGYIGVGGVFVRRKSEAKRFSLSEVSAAKAAVLLNPKLDNFDPVHEPE